MNRAFTILLVVYFTMSVATLVAFGRDKRAAQAGRWRIRERTLLVMSLAGGWPGAFLARQIFRHKTRDQPFVLYFYLVTALNVTLLAAALWLLLR